MEKIDYNLISSSTALSINKALLGTPPENRVIIAVSTDEKKTKSGLILPTQSEEEMPKKGVVVAKGPLNDDPTHEIIKIGDIVHYGKYGGKEIFPRVPGLAIDDLKFFVLSSSEIIFIEPNDN